MHEELIKDLKAVETKIEAAKKSKEGTRHAIGTKVWGKVRTAIEILEQDQREAANLKAESGKLTTAGAERPAPPAATPTK